MTTGRGAVDRLVAVGLGLVLALGRPAPAAPPADGPASGPAPAARSRGDIVYHGSRAFGIPVNITPADRPRYKQIKLYVTDDGGGRWNLAGTMPIDAQTPERPSFVYRVARDGEYWLTVQTVDTRGRLYPPLDADVEPQLKVIVDTVAPSISLEALPRRGSTCAVRWEAIDDHLLTSSIRLEFQADGPNGGWRTVPLHRPARIGDERWDAGTSEPFQVRMSASDRAGNVKTVTLMMPDGLPSAGGFGGAGRSGDGDQGGEIPPARGTFVSSETERGPSSASASASPAPVFPAGPPPMPGFGAMGEGPGGVNPFDSGEAPSGRRARPASTPGPGPAAGSGDPAAPSPPILVRSPKFALKYEVEDAGPNGPAAVELFVTTDGGRTWYSRGEDPDRASPFPVDLGGEGAFGLKLVAKSAANQGDQPPKPGEPPSTIVEVDAAGPIVKLEPVRIVGSKAIIIWQANDPHPAGRPVMISVKADAPDGQWRPITTAPIENTGQYTWPLPANCPPKIHVRVDVVDALGNQGFADTTETGAVLVDRSKPKGRITGLDLGQDAPRPSARPIR